MKSKNRIRPFKKVCAAVLAAALLSGGFGTSGVGLQTAEAADFDVEYSTATFQNIPYIADEAGVSIYIEDPGAFALEDATLTTSVKGVDIITSDCVTTNGTTNIASLVWTNWNNIKLVSSGTKYRACEVQTGVTANNPITLSWEDAASTQYGESLDVAMVITGLEISYVGRDSNHAYNGAWAVNASDNKPRIDLSFGRQYSDGRLMLQSYGVAADGSASTAASASNLTFGVKVEYHLEFYNANEDEVYGTYLSYFEDLDIKDTYAYMLAVGKNGWSYDGVADDSTSTWHNKNSDFIESITFPDSVTTAYAIDSDSSILQCSGRRVSGQRTTTSSDSNLVASVQAGVSAEDTLTWTGSGCDTFLFESYSPGTGTITLSKEADEESQEVNYDEYITAPDLAGALYAVRQESTDGSIAGFFITDSEGTGYVASAAAEADEVPDDAVACVTYVAEDTGTELYYYCTGDSSKTMEVNVGQYYVEELAAPDGFGLDTTIYEASVTNDANVAVTSTETFEYQQFTLTKESLDAEGEEDTGDKVSYSYAVTISGLESGEEFWYSVNGKTVKSANANSSGSRTVSVSLKNGESAVFEIPIGAKYKITEYSNAKIASYTVEDANSKGKIAQASGANTTSQTSLSTAAETADSGEDVTVTFINTEKESVTVTLKKTSIDLYGDTDKYDTDTYTYTIKLGGLKTGDTYSYTDRDGETHSVTLTTSNASKTITLSLLPDETVSFTVPVGATYTITEAANAKIPSYTVADANTKSGGTIVSASGQETEAATALSTAAETAEKGEKITVTFINQTVSGLTAAGSLSFDANGGTYSDGTDIKTLKYDGDAYGYEESDFTSRSTNYTMNEEASDSYAVPEREGYTFLGWASSADADTAYYTANYKKASNLAKIENMFPELVINTNLSSTACYAVFVPNTGLSDDFTWYYAGNYFNNTTDTTYDELMISLGADSESSLTALLTSSCEDDYYYSVTAERDQLYYYTSLNDGEYILPAGTYYCAYETDSGEVTTASITLEQSDNEDEEYFSTFSQTLYAVWEKVPTYLSLQKTGNSGQNIDPDLDGALYAVHQDDASGEIVGYFITDADGTGYAASTDSADADSTLKLSVSYDDTTFYATGGTLLELDSGTYYVEELAAPDLYETKDIGKVTVTTDNTEDNPAAAVYEAGEEETVNHLKVSLTKVSRNADGSLNDSDSSYYSYTIRIGNLESREKITYVTCMDGDEITKTATAGTSGSVSISRPLHSGDEVYFLLPVGAQYTITEGSNSKIASYTVEDANTDSGGTIVSASGANEGPYAALSTETETADDGEDVTVTFTNTTVEKTQVCLSKQSTRQLAVNGISPVITNDMSEDGSYSNGFTLSVSAGSDSYTSYQWYYSTGGNYNDFSILEDNDRYSLSGTSTDTLTYDSGSGNYWGNSSVWLCCVMTDASGNRTVSKTVYMTYYEGDSTEYYSLDKTSSMEITIADEDDTSSYEVYVEFAAAISADYITYESDTNEDNSGSFKVTSRTGSTTVSIQNGETITFSNVPVGAEYYFREESNDRTASYEITNAGSSGTVEGDASYSNETSGLALTTSIQTAESGEETTVTYINEEVEKTQVCLSKQSVTRQLTVNGISPVITNDMSEDGSYSNGFTLSVSAGSDSYTSYQWYYSTGGNYYDFSILEENDRYSLSGTSTDTLIYDSGSGTYWGNSSVWLCCVMTDASGNRTVSETAYMTYYQGSGTEYYSLDKTSSTEITLADEDDTSSYEVYVEFAAAMSVGYITYESDTNADNSGGFKVTDGTGSTTVSIQSGETITFSNVPVGAEYYFREESNARIASYEITNAGSSGTIVSASGANEGPYTALSTKTETAESGEKTTVTYINEEEEKTAGVRVLKVDADGEPLAGAVFDLYDAEDELLAEGLETGEDGYTEIVEDLAAGDYYFVETDAPDGYAVTGENPIDFTITEDDLGTTVTVTAADNTLQILPNAGGSGIWLLLLMSTGAFCAAVLILRGRRTGIAPV